MGEVDDRDDRSPPYAQFRYGDTVTALHDHGHDGVEVHFRHGPPNLFDLVIGADGLHSHVRGLAFGPEPRFVTSLGMYFATSTLDRVAPDPRIVLLHNAAGRAVATHPGTGREGVAFIFRAPPGLDRTDPRQLLRTTYAGMGWRVPELLDHARRDEQLWFDTVSRADVPCWSRSQVVLAGDAAGCISLLGEGSSMAIVGAATLAQALTVHTGDVPTALARYEHNHGTRLRHHTAAQPSPPTCSSPRPGSAQRCETTPSASGRRSREPAHKARRRIP